jgi:hypothetical protein
MSNTLLTNNIITRLAVRLWRNSNAFLKNIDTQYDSQFATVGAKEGTSIRIRLPVDYIARVGQAASVQDTSETSITLTVATQVGVDMSFSSVDRTMAIDDFTKRYIRPAVNTTCGYVATTIIGGSEGGVSNFVSNVDGSNNIIAPTQTTFLNARALLTNNSPPVENGRMLVVDPNTMAGAVSLLSGLFNPASAVSEQYRSGEISNALGFDWHEDPTVIKHTTASYSGTKTVNGASQTGTTIVCNAITGGLAAGDIITFAGVYAVNRITKQSTGALQQFAVTAAVASGGTSISIYPALIPASSGNAVQYQTCTVSPANAAVITVVSASASIYRKNLAYIPEAITMATVDLVMPPNVDVARQEMDGVSIRVLTQYQALQDINVTRLDVLFGYVYVRPEWCCVVAAPI